MLTQATASPVSQLTKYSAGSLKELLRISIPLMLTFFSGNFLMLCDRFFLGHYSVESMEGAVTASALIILFQQPLMRIASMTQVFVGTNFGASRHHLLGELVWQMIWFSLFSMVITLPLAFFIAPLIFGEGFIASHASSYFYPLAWANFLFPLSIALSSFYIGRGKTKVVFLSTLLMHVINIGLDPLLIFGIKGILPPLGAQGAAIATAIAQGSYCTLLFVLFLGKEKRALYKTDNYAFKWRPFWELLRVALPRAASRLIVLSAWVAAATLFLAKGGDYMHIFSIAATLTCFFNFINDGMHQGIVTLASNLIGAKNYQPIWKVVRSAFILLITSSLLLLIPFVFYPEILAFLFPKIVDANFLPIFKQACLWIWAYFVCYGFNAIAMGILTSSKDTLFHLIVIPSIWLTTYLPLYYAINAWNWPPEQLWSVMAWDCLVFGTIFFLRALKEKWRPTESIQEL